MIANTFNRKFQILKRLEDTRDESWGDQYQYQLSAEYDCLFQEKMGAVLKADGGNDISITGYLVTIEEVSEVDRLVIDGYEYDIGKGGIQEVGNPVTAEVEYRKIAVVRRGLYNADTITINSGV